MSQKGSSVELRDDENCGGTGAMFFRVSPSFAQMATIRTQAFATEAPMSCVKTDPNTSSSNHLIAKPHTIPILSDNPHSRSVVPGYMIHAESYFPDNPTISPASEDTKAYLQ